MDWNEVLRMGPILGRRSGATRWRGNGGFCRIPSRFGFDDFRFVRNSFSYDAETNSSESLE